MNKKTIGVFSQNDLRDLISAGHLKTTYGFDKKHVGPASIDVTVARNEAYRLEWFGPPSGKRGEKVRDLLPSFGAKPINMGHILVPGETYIALASISVNLPKGIYGYGNAKSTSGRNMCLSRTVADGIEGYDSLDNRTDAWSGEVWLVIEPMVFPIILTDQECYSQIRFFDGDSRFSEIDLKKQLQKKPLLLRQDGTQYAEGELSIKSNDGSVFTTLYAKAGKLVGFHVKRTRKPLDLTARGLNPHEYFEPVYAQEDPSDPDGGRITLEPGEFYLLSPNEMVDVPVDLCSELAMLDPRAGLFFPHFAGFFDSGFRGVPTLEVMAPLQTTLRHRSIVGRFRYERMRSDTISYELTGNYSGQVRTTLPKQFKMLEDWKLAMA